MNFNQGQECAEKCALEKLGVFDETNGFSVEKLTKMNQKDGYSRSVARSMARKCAVTEIGMETRCEWASRGLKCLNEEAKKATKESSESEDSDE